MKLENQLQVTATAEQAWSLLMDVPRVVPCMPGAELVDTVGEDRWKARMKVKLGPMSLTFDVDVERTAVEEAGRRVELKATARETRNRGRAKATVESVLTEAGDGVVTIAMTTDLSLQGAVAQYGTGIVRDVSQELVRSFASSLQKELEPAVPHAAPTPADGVGATTAAAPSPVNEPAPAPAEQPSLSVRRLVVSVLRSRLADLLERLAARLREPGARP